MVSQLDSITLGGLEGLTGKRSKLKTVSDSYVLMAYMILLLFHYHPLRRHFHYCQHLPVVDVKLSGHGWLIFLLHYMIYVLLYMAIRSMSLVIVRLKLLNIKYMSIYNINIDQWGQLPPPGHYRGILHIIGEKLAIVGGRLSDTNKWTDKVPTFDDSTQNWISYYPNLLSVRSRPGVASYKEYVIFACGIFIDVNTV